GLARRAWRRASTGCSGRFIPYKYLHHIALLGVAYGFGSVTQRESARDEWCWIDLAGAEQGDGFSERAAARTDYGNFFDDQWPGFHRRGAVKRGFQNQGAAGLGHLLRQGKARRRTGRFHNQTIRLFDSPEITRIALNFVRLSSRLLCQL